MREPLKDRVRLEHIVEASNNVARYMDGKTFEDIQADDMMCYAIVYNILSIGEAAYHLTKAFRKEHPETDWEVIIKMRNVLAHDYYKLKIQTVWEVASHDLPLLQEQVARYISETDWDEWEKNEVAVVETAVHKNIIQTAERMKSRGYDVTEICKITGLTRDEIERL